MLRALHISILLAVCIFTAPGQVRVVDVRELGNNIPSRFYPDVEGKVVVSESYFNYFTTETNRSAITIFPGFPLPRTGANECGGVYGNLDEDPEFELIYPVGTALHAFNIDGSMVAGWPQQLDFPTDGAPAFGDIDGDGVGEIVVSTHQLGSFAFGTVYAFEIDGTDVTGFPVETEGGGVRTPALADLNGDSALEIIITMRDFPDGLVYVYRGDGTNYPGWPVRMDYVPGSSAAVGDINGDDSPEIVAESYYGLHAFTADGLLVDGFPYYPGLGRVFSYSAPVLADLDGDGMREIIFGDHSIENGSGAIHVIDHEGNPLDGWPKITGSWIYGPPSIGDINGDGLPDIAVGDQTLSLTPVNKVYAWTGSLADTLDGFPITDIFGVNTQILLADFDGDEKLELVFDDNTSDGKYPGYNHDGTIMDGWPLQVNGSTYFINPLVVDIDLDGLMDISGGGFADGAGSTNIYLWNANVEMDDELAVLPVLQYNTRHNGVYGDTFMVGVKEHGGRGAWGHGSFRIFPNPASDYLSIIPEKKLSGNKIIVSLYNSTGVLYLTREFYNDGSEIRLDLEGFPTGFYWICLNGDSNLRYFAKFVLISR